MATIDVVYALHDFGAENEDELSFKSGDKIEVVEKDDEFGDGWWQVSKSMRFAIITKSVLPSSGVRSYGEVGPTSERSDGAGLRTLGVGIAVGSGTTRRRGDCPATMTQSRFI